MEYLQNLGAINGQRDRIGTTCCRDYVKAKSHQRKLVDGSDPAYKEIGFRNLGIPPTEVGGLFRSDLFT